VLLEIADLKVHFDIKDGKQWFWQPSKTLKAVDGDSSTGLKQARKRPSPNGSSGGALAQISIACGQRGWNERHSRKKSVTGNRRPQGAFRYQRWQAVVLAAVKSLISKCTLRSAISSNTLFSAMALILIPPPA
jgi:hypothetical protein